MIMITNTIILLLIQAVSVVVSVTNNGYQKEDVSPTCKLTNLTRHQAPFKLNNFALTLASKSGLIKKLAKKMDPLIIGTKFPFDPEIGHVGPVSYNFQLAFDKMNISGLETISLKPIKVLDAYSFELGGSMSNFIVRTIYSSKI
jgi:hypothetical protein